MRSVGKFCYIASAEIDVIPQRFWGFSACIWHILQAGSALKAMKEVHWKFFWLACDRNRIHKMHRFFAMNFWRIFCWNGILISSAAWFFQRTSCFNFRFSRVVQISKRLNQLQASQSLAVKKSGLYPRKLTAGGPQDDGPWKRWTP